MRSAMLARRCGEVAVRGVRRDELAMHARAEARLELGVQGTEIGGERGEVRPVSVRTIRVRLDQRFGYALRLGDGKQGVEPEVRIELPMDVPVPALVLMAVLVMACIGSTARVRDSEERQARRRATDIPFLLDLHLFEVDGKHMTAVGIGDVHHLADNEHRGDGSSENRFGRLDQLHGFDQFAVVGVKRVQCTGRVEDVEGVAVA